MRGREYEEFWNFTERKKGEEERVEKESFFNRIEILILSLLLYSKIIF